jgi:GNAT superfamily N-acetyltransferase
MRPARTDVPIFNAGGNHRLALARTIGLACADLPLAQWLVPAAAHRVTRLSNHYAAVLAHALRHGRVQATLDLHAVAIWLPGVSADTAGVDVGAIWGPDAARFDSFRQATAWRPADKHVFLAMVAVHPRLRRRGIASALLASGPAGQPVYGVATSEPGWRLLDQCGFTAVRKAMTVADDAPPAYGMWRAAT